jgi:molecular chaperone GrpE
MNNDIPPKVTIQRDSIWLTCKVMFCAMLAEIIGLAKKLTIVCGKSKGIILANMEQEKDKIDEKEVLTENAQSQNTANGEDSTPADQSTLGKLTAELAEAKDKYVRLYADFENFRRRTSKEKLDYMKSAGEDVIVSILPILDDFERAQKSLASQEGSDPAKEGIQLIYNKLYKALEQKGLKPMESIGKPFNLELHESITQVPAPSEDLKGKIIDEVEKGYFLHDKVIRFAKVIIGS